MAGLRHILELPGRVLDDAYFPAALETGDLVVVEGERFLVERAVPLHDALHEQVIRARLRRAPPLEPGSSAR